MLTPIRLYYDIILLVLKIEKYCNKGRYSRLFFRRTRCGTVVTVVNSRGYMGLLFQNIFLGVPNLPN